jgi:probable rRNA maturation factor
VRSIGARIEIVVDCAEWVGVCPRARQLCRAAASRTLAAASSARAAPRLCEVTIVLGDDAAQQRLNRTYRGLDRPTNVLSFPAWNRDDPEMPGAPVLLGDVALAFGTVAREADEQGKSFADHLRHLVVHGVLHLLGYDHGGEREAEEMERLETDILAGLGVPDPYRDTI